jgi:anaphase-promoting complex subunit 4
MDASDDHGAPPAFAHLVTAAGPGPGAVAAWCPSMDLLALAPPGGGLAVRRLDWARVWAAPDAVGGGRPLALAWRPDGHALAACVAAGGVLVRRAADGRPTAAAARREGAPPFVGLAWGAVVAGGGVLGVVAWATKMH